MPATERSERAEDPRARHPRWHATRHLRRALLEGLLPLLGVGALLRALVPRVDWPSLPFELPRIGLPLDWLFAWLDLSVPAGLVDVLRAVRPWAPLVVAAVVTVAEVARRRTRAPAEDTETLDGDGAGPPS